jgi:hypothetical protein
MAIKWITKQSNKKADVTIKQGNSKGKGRVYLTFRNDMWKKITATGYIKVGIDGNRAYFCQGLTKSDFKITIKGDCNNGYVSLHTDLLDGFDGDYTLKRDSKTNLRYIQK